MHVIVTCGPSYEPVDQVRRLTNFSTGELGLMLSATLARAGHMVTCFKGEGSSSPLTAEGADIRTFTTNDDLRTKLFLRAGEAPCRALFHTAALNDFRVEVRGKDGTELTGRKLSSQSTELTLTLVPATKLLPELRDIFPSAYIVGWKFELDGNRIDVLTKAGNQIVTCHSDACVVNGAAWGTGFGFVEPERALREFPTKQELCDFLTVLLDRADIAGP